MRLKNVLILITFLFFSVGIYASDFVVDCDINSGPCKKTTDRGTVTLDVSPKPIKVMNELEFIVILDNMQDYNHLKLDLSMPGMYMGKNEVILKRLGKGRYKGKGIIPMCPTGKTLWQATIDLQEIKVGFFFNVIH